MLGTGRVSKDFPPRIFVIIAENWGLIYPLEIILFSNDHLSF